MRRLLWAGLGLAIWAVAAALLAAPRTVPAGVVAAVLGSLLGAVTAWRLAATRVRLPVIWLGGAACLILVQLVARTMVSWRPFPAVLGAEPAYLLSEVAAWLGSLLVVVAVAQTSSRRHPSWVTLELLLVGGVVAGLLAAHREGFINRPYGLVDAVWGRGYDPLPLFLAVRLPRGRGAGTAGGGQGLPPPLRPRRRAAGAGHRRGLPAHPRWRGQDAGAPGPGWLRGR